MNCRLYVSEFNNVFVQIAKCICLICKNIFVKLVICVCPNHEMLLMLMVFPPLWATTPILSERWSRPLLMVLLVTMITFDDISRVYFSIMHLLNENLIHGHTNWVSSLRIKYVPTKESVLCALSIYQICKKGFKTAAFISKSVAVNCLKRLTRGQRSVALY